MPKLKSTVLALADELFRAQIYYGASKALREKIERPEFEKVRNLFMASYYACLREALLSLSKLLIVNEDSISILYLINYSEQNTGEFVNATPDQVREAVQSSRSELIALNATIAKLRPLRDGELAHLDKKHVDNPQSIIPSPIEFAELERCLDKSLEILRRFMKIQDDSRINFQDIGNVISLEVEMILSALENLN